MTPPSPPGGMWPLDLPTHEPPLEGANGSPIPAPIERLSTLELVLLYRFRGWPTVPIVPGRRATYVSWKPFQNRLPTEAELGDWLERYPDANWGVACGAFSNLVCIDVDERHGGFASLALLEVEHGSLSLNAEVATAGGTHLHFQHPGGRVRNSDSKLGPGIDVKGDGSLVPMPPSVHASGVPYRWCWGPSDPLPVLPAWWADQIIEKPIPRPATPIVLPAIPGHGYGQAALREELEALAGAPDKQRNTTLNTCALKLYQLVGAGLLSEDEVTPRLLHVARGIGLGEIEIRNTLASARKAGLARPREVRS